MIEYTTLASLDWGTSIVEAAGVHD